MSYEGTIQNGVVVFDDGVNLPDGTRVRVEPVVTETACAPRGESLSELLLRFAGAAGDGLPEDLARNHDHYLYGTPKR